MRSVAESNKTTSEWLRSFKTLGVEVSVTDSIEAQVRLILNEIVDPCSRVAGSPAGLDDMGLVRQVDVTGVGEAATVRVVIGLTEFGCMMGGAFLHDACERLNLAFGEDHVDVQLGDSYDWVPAHMSAAYRARLAAHRREAQPSDQGKRRLPPIESRTAPEELRTRLIEG